jgi:S1-C subfamily serine protease
LLTLAVVSATTLPTLGQPLQDFAVAKPDGPEPVRQTEDSPVTPAVPSHWRELYHKVNPSIVLISRGNAEGTGFLFGSQRHVATALHVVSHVGTITVVTRDGKRREARVVAWDEEWDLSILELEEPIAAPVLQTVRDGQGQVGDMVAAIGNPWGAEQRKLKGSEAPVWALSQGVISAPPGDYVQTDAPVNPGNSGGPLLTRDGEVVGVVVVRIAEADGISFATSAKRLQALYGRVNQQGDYSPNVERLLWQLSWLPVA